VQQSSLVGWLESHVARSSAYRLTDVYRLFVEGTEYSVEIFENDVEPSYRYIARVTNVKTGRSSGLGNGGATPEEALVLFHWDSIIEGGHE